MRFSHPWLAVMVFVGLVFSFTFAEAESIKPKPVPWDLSQLYLYDEGGIVERLMIANKIALRFVHELSEDERKRFFERWEAITIKQDKEDKGLFVMTYPPEFGQDRIVRTLRGISSTGFAEVYPVVIKDNLEAIAEGVEVVPKIHLSAEVLVQRLKKYGDFKVRQVTPGKDGFRITLDSVESPLNVYLLANLFHQDAWVLRSSPMFRYLEQAVSAELRVEPVTGTLGQTRQVSLVVTILDPKFVLREDLLNRFGEGKEFLPKASANPPLGLLFSVLDDDKEIDASCRCRKRDYRQGRARVLVFTWKFKHYELGLPTDKPNQGEWLIASPPIFLEGGTKVLEIKASPATFVVMSLVGSVAIPDMPSPLPVEISGQVDTVSPEAEAFVEPKYWFDKFVKSPIAIVRGLFGVAGFAILVVLVEIFRPSLVSRIRYVLLRRVVWGDAKDLRRRVQEPLRESNRTAYETIYKLTVKLLSSALGFPLQLTSEYLDEVETSLTTDTALRIRLIVTEYESTFVSDFKPDAEKLQRMARSLESLVDEFLPRYVERRMRV